MKEPAYSFSIPSIHDDTVLDTRIYHPKNLYKVLNGGLLRAAVVAHPYAPLGGSYDDPVVFSITETLLAEGFVVGTFNFRGAGDSKGKTSWTGKPEQDDYMSVVGLLIHYMQALHTAQDLDDKLEPIPSISNHVSPPGQPNFQHDQPLQLVLGGYSYGSLVLARLPPTSAIVQTFQSAEVGTAAAEIILRARTLAKETNKSLEELKGSRGRQSKSNEQATSPGRRIGVSPITVGGEEGELAPRRKSKDSRNSGDLVRKGIEAPGRILGHIRRSSTPDKAKSRSGISVPTLLGRASSGISTTYLLVSTVVLPFSNSLCPPGPPTAAFSLKKGTYTTPGALFLDNPTLAVFGSSDGFTSSKRLRSWAEKQASESKSKFEWTEIEGAGHFWHELGVMQALQRRIASWVKSGQT